MNVNRVRIEINGDGQFVAPAQNTHLIPGYTPPAQAAPARPERPDRPARDAQFPGRPGRQGDIRQGNYKISRREQYPSDYAQTFEPRAATQPPAPGFRLPPEALRSGPGPATVVNVTPAAQSAPAAQVQPQPVAPAPSRTCMDVLQPCYNAMRPYVIPIGIFTGCMLAGGVYLVYRKIAEAAAEPFPVATYTYPSYSYP
jgi:hypothetical protein